MFINKRGFTKNGGFNEKYWPGEDSKLCNTLINRKFKIYYLYDLIVYHYRRSNLKKHIRQIFRYSYTRGKFFRDYDTNSRKLIYLIPSLFAIYILLNLILLKPIYFIPIVLIYFALLLEVIFILKSKNFLLIILSPITILLNILIYGIGFIFSFILPDYKTKLGR